MHDFIGGIMKIGKVYVTIFHGVDIILSTYRTFEVIYFIYIILSINNFLAVTFLKDERMQGKCLSSHFIFKICVQ